MIRERVHKIKIMRNQYLEKIREKIHSDKEGVLSGGKIFIKWIILACLTGIVVGSISVLFVKALSFVTAFRGAHPQIIFALPVGGIAIVLLYRLLRYPNDKGTNVVLATVHAHDQVPLKMAPLIFCSTVITQLFGGSAGREGAALQLGGSIGNQLGRWMRLDENDTRVMVMCGMSAAFSAIFGTPMAAAIFSLEVISVGIMHYAALVPCVLASITASMFASTMEIHPESFVVKNIPEFALFPGVKIACLGIMCALLSIIFCRVIHQAMHRIPKLFKNPYLRVVVGGVTLILLVLLLGTTDYCGTGIDLIACAIEGQVSSTAFIWKLLFTAITLGCGFKGGEIVPTFCVGATFGCVFGHIIGLSPGLCAAVGMVAMFCGVTNCPITAMIIGFELFGFGVMKYLLIAVSISYMLSGCYGLYPEQTIVYSKFKTQFVNRKAH